MIASVFLPHLSLTCIIRTQKASFRVENKTAEYMYIYNVHVGVLREHQLAFPIFGPFLVPVHPITWFHYYYA